MQMDPIIQARRRALREAQTWLLRRAREMNDPHARLILNVAASDWGNDKLRGFDPVTGKGTLAENDPDGVPFGEVTNGGEIDD